ncbi:hypothetical protein [Vibrio genomosp. F10]|nr:hypothetical protein [Vibrio genomosp. F10]OEF06037.1 hypothetical protein A1QI_07130 [Vibrio genomosp. F10 str. 9ZB36]
MKKLLIAGLISFTSITAFASDWDNLTPREQADVAREVTLQLSSLNGMKIDEITTVGAVFMASNTIHYKMVIDKDYYGNTIEQIKTFVPEMYAIDLKNACTNPDVLKGLTFGMATKYTYSTVQ